MSSRKEEKERLRRERLEAEQQAARSGKVRLWAGYALAGLLAGAVLIAFVYVLVRGDDDSTAEAGNGNAAVDVHSGVVPDDLALDEREGTALPDGLIGANLQQAADEAGCKLELDLPDEGATHISEDDRVPEYGTNPPTSGNHLPNPLADGAYATAPSPLNYVHSLEHGRIEIQYDPNLPEADQLEIKGLFDADPQGMLLFPNPEIDAAVAATAWRQLLTCNSFEGESTLAALAAFRDTFRGQGPEAIPL